MGCQETWVAKAQRILDTYLEVSWDLPPHWWHWGSLCQLAPAAQIHCCHQRPWYSHLNCTAAAATQAEKGQHPPGAVGVSSAIVVAWASCLLCRRKKEVLSSRSGTSGCNACLSHQHQKHHGTSIESSHDSDDRLQTGAGQLKHAASTALRSKDQICCFASRQRRAASDAHHGNN